MKKILSNLSRCFFKASYWLLFLITFLVCSAEIYGQTNIKFSREADDTSKKQEADIPTFDEVGWIYFYLTGYYSKWEAEQNQNDPLKVGIKHKWGQSAYWDDTVFCWSTIGLNSPKDSVMYGPHYRQDKRYKRELFSYYGYFNSERVVTYTPRFRMALDKKGNADRDEEVCVIKVVFSYKDQITGILHDTTFLKRTLKVEDFDTSGNFKYFYFQIDPGLSWYNYYPESYTQYPPPPLNYIDWEENTGIQFQVDWLRTDTLCTLYIDYVEVYDRDGWDNYLMSPEMTIEILKDYISSYLDWKYIPFLSSQIKITTIDNYFPVSLIDSLLKSAGAPSLLPEVYQYRLSTSPGSDKPDKWIRKENQKTGKN